MNVSDNVLRYLSRHSPDYLTFNNSYSTFILILAMIFNSGSSTYFYRVRMCAKFYSQLNFVLIFIKKFQIIQHTGLFGFVFCVWLFLIGFYIVSLILALVYDSYEEQMLSQTIGIADKVKFFREEAEFSFKPDSNFLVSLQDCNKRNDEFLNLKQLDELYVSKKVSNKAKAKNKRLSTKIDNKSMEYKLNRNISSNIKLNKLNFDSFYKQIEVANTRKFNFFFRLLENIFICKENLNDFFFDLCLTKGHLITIQIEYIVWAKFFLNLIIFQLDQPVDYYKIKDEKLRIFYYLLFIDNFLTLFMVIEISLKILLTGLKTFFSKLINIFDTCIVIINILSFISRLLDMGELTR